MRSIRRSRAAVGLLTAAFLVAASGCAADRPDRLVSSPATDTTEAISSPESTTPSTAAADTLESAPVMQSAAVAVNAPFGASAVDTDFVPVQWLVPWDDGFLAVGVRHAPQPLPDQLPPEVADLFPPEVNALFPDGLPPTQQEAIEILEEADLFDEVMDVVNEYPEAMDALQSAPRPAASLVATWSADGDTWTPTEMTAPDGLGDLQQLAVSGDRLTIAGTSPPGEDRVPWTVTVASTTDLETWTTESFEIRPPEGVPDDVQVWVSPIGVAANDEHWVVRTMVDASIDPFEYLPDEVQERLMTGGYGIGIEPDGVMVEFDGESDEGIEVQRYTWAELGVPDAVVPFLQGSQSRVELWSGTWGGEPSVTVGDEPFGTLLATSAGFLDFGDGVAFSPDGTTWTQVRTPQPNLWFQAAAPLGDDVVAIAGTPYGETSIRIVDATGTNWTDVEVAGLDETFSAWNSASSPAFILANEPSAPEPETLVVEHDGFELTRVFGGVVSYELVDLSTGAVVAEESVDLRTTQTASDGPFEHLTEDMLGVTITDPATGAMIVQIPQSAMSEAWSEATGGGDEAFEYDQPDLWLLATADGESWLLEDLDDPDPAEPNPPQHVTVNGTTLLVGTYGWEPGTDIWQRFTLTE
jgi:hypothetical protein